MAEASLKGKKPAPASGSTIADWVKNVLRLSSIDMTTFKAHSTRSVASIKAFVVFDHV